MPPKMLDPQLLLRDARATCDRLLKRNLDASWLQTVIAELEARRDGLQATESLRQEQNQASAEMQRLLKAKDAAGLAGIRDALKALKTRVQAQEQALTELEQTVQASLLQLPNVPAEDVPPGKSESDNQEIRRWGTPPSAAQVGETPEEHWAIGERLGILDFARASNMSGPRFAVAFGQGVALERALSSLMLDMAQKNGYRAVSPPLLVRPASMELCGQYPKFIGESFETQERELVLIPTAEVALVNLHQQEIVDEEALPLRYTAHTPCFRREAGAAGRDTRGLIRQHQFYKVELVSITRPEDSVAEHERMLGHAEQILQALGLHYRVVNLCAGDLGFAAQKTYDIEVWLPGQQAFREISSCSNCGDFQARRAQLRLRPAGSKQKPRLAHTLNGSALAVGRTLVAVLENYQRADGTVEIPEVLRPYMGGQTHLRAESMYKKAADT